MTVVGIHQQYQGKVDLHTVGQTLGAYPLTEATREFNANPIDPQNLVPKVEKVCRPVWNEDLIAVWSVKPKPAEVRNGKWRPFFQQLAAHIRDQKLTNKFVLVIWHEPENDLGKWFDRPEDFTDMFNTVQVWVKGIEPKLLTMHAALGYRYRDKGEINDAMAVRWKTHADMNAIDLYSGRSFPLSMTFAESSAFKRWHRFVVGGPGNPWSASERGFTVGDTGRPSQASLSQRSDTIRREADWLATDPIGRECAMVLLWDSVGTEGDEGLKIRDPAGIEAVKYYMDRIKNPPQPEQPPTPEVPMTDCPLCQGEGKIRAGQTITITRENSTHV